MNSVSQETSFLSQSFFTPNNASTFFTQEELEQDERKAMVLASCTIALGIAYIAIIIFTVILTKQRRFLPQNNVIVHLQKDEKLQAIDTFLNEQV